MSSPFYVYVDPAHALARLKWETAIREAGFDLLLETPLDLEQPARVLRCLYRGEPVLVGAAREQVDSAALKSAGIDPALSLRLSFSAESAPGPASQEARFSSQEIPSSDSASEGTGEDSPLPALICAAVVCARLGGTLLDPEAPAPLRADQAIAWAFRLEASRDAQYRREHGGRPPPALLARRRRQRRTAALLVAGVAIALPLLGWGLSEWSDHVRRQRAAEMDARFEHDSQVERARQAAEQEARRIAQERAAAERAARYLSEADLARLSVDDYKFVPTEAPEGEKRWLFGHRQDGGFYAFEASAKCGSELLHRDPAVLDQEMKSAPGANRLVAVTVPAKALAPLSAAQVHLPKTWTLITMDGVTQIEMRAAATAFYPVNGPCLYLLTAPFEVQKETLFNLRDHSAWGNGQTEQLALAFPGDISASALLRREAAPLMLEESSQRARHQAEVIDGEAFLKSDPKLRAVVTQMLAEQKDPKLLPRMAGYQEFRAVLFVERGNEAFRFYYFRGEGRMLWCLVRLEDQKVLNVSALDSGYFPDVLATVDVDGDGADELLVRAVIWEGELLKLLRPEAGKLRVLGTSSYIGI